MVNVFLVRPTGKFLVCVAWRFCRAGCTSGEAAGREIRPEARENEREERGNERRRCVKKLLPPQSPRGFSALARLYYLARPTKIAMLRKLENSRDKRKF